MNIVKKKAADNEQLYTLAIRATNDSVWDLDFASDRLTWNDAFFENFGFSPADVELTLQWWADRLHTDDHDRVVQHFDEVVASGGELFVAEYRFRRADGSYAWIFDRGYIVRDAEGRPLRGVGAMQDQTQRKLSEDALSKSEALNRSIVEANPDCVSILDVEGTVVFANCATMEAYGITDRERLIGRPWGELLEKRYYKEVAKALEDSKKGESSRLTIEAPARYGGETRWYESILTPIFDSEGKLMRHLVMSRDVTAHKAAQDEIRWIANHDPLTQLPNRRLFQQRLHELVEDASKGGTSFALLMIDVDQFKQVNDRLGHDAGDQLLKTLARRLTELLRDEDFVARLGGDEFAVLLQGISETGALQAAAEKIIVSLNQPWIYAGRLLDCRATIGASMFGRDAKRGSELLKNADVALYTAKDRGRSQVALFEPKMRSVLNERSRMIELARKAVRDDMLIPYYQPQIDLRSGRITGFEALLRLDHPSIGLLSPSHISAALEDVDIAGDIGRRMARCVLKDMAHWRDQGVAIGHVALNASAADFRKGDFADRLLNDLDRAGVSPRQIQLEVTETVFLGRGADHVQAALQSLSKKGIRIALDDFGTGYASLSHLQKYPIDIIKIDRSFIRDMTADPGAAAIVQAVLSLGTSLNLEVIAEGIETVEEERSLREKGCHLVQGYLYGKPMPAKDVLPAWLNYRGAGSPPVASRPARRLAG